MKKVINTRFHTVADYLVGSILLIPYTVNYFMHTEDTWILSALGIAIVTYSMLTDYELGLVKLIPMKLHLFFDFLSGVFLIVLPFIVPLHSYFFYWPLLLGICELIMIIFSSSKPYARNKQDLNIIHS